MSHSSSALEQHQGGGSQCVFLMTAARAARITLVIVSHLALIGVGVFIAAGDVGYIELRLLFAISSVYACLTLLIHVIHHTVFKGDADVEDSYYPRRHSDLAQVIVALSVAAVTSMISLLNVLMNFEALSSNVRVMIMAFGFGWILPLFISACALVYVGVTLLSLTYPLLSLLHVAASVLLAFLRHHRQHSARVLHSCSAVVPMRSYFDRTSSRIRIHSGPCIVCNDRPVDTVFCAPRCLHGVSCSVCASRLSACPVCREPLCDVGFLGLEVHSPAPPPSSDGDEWV